MIRVNASQADNFLKPIMQSVSKGEFMMGSDEYSDEKPMHKVTINYDFEISKYQVTFDEYDLYCEDVKKEKPKDNGWGRGRRPVINVSWNDAVAYYQWLNTMLGIHESHPCRYRLPTEAELEYSTKAGTTTKWSFGDDEVKLEEYAWYDKNSEAETHPTGELNPNPWGLYDMHGNVSEWCGDWYNKDIKGLRGGSWSYISDRTRSAYRNYGSPTGRNIDRGFRLLRTLPL